MSGKPLTGRKVLAILVGAFAVVIAANLAMLFAATGTFPGLVVKNSYVASQGWDAKTEAQRALGWQARVVHDGEALSVALTDAEGAPVHGLEVAATVGRPASGRTDRTLTLAETGGAYAAPLALAPGRWRVAVTATGTDGARFETHAELVVPVRVAEGGG